MAVLDSQRARASAAWLYGFICLQFVCQIAVLAQIDQARTGLRVMTFASSLAMLLLVPAGGPLYPTRPLVVALICFNGFGFVHPELNNLYAGVAQVTLTLAVWAPVFWATRISLPPNALRTAMLLLWGFNALSAVTGVLQTYYPDRFSPSGQFVEQLYGEYAGALRIELADGTSVWRPMGLTDSPGGAAVSGQFAFLVGLVLAVSDSNRLLRLAGCLGAVAGMFCIYLCQIRTIVVVSGVTVLVYMVITAYCKRMDRASLMAMLGVAAVLAAFGLAVDVGGTAVTDRLSTLTEERADQVYYLNRGIFLTDTLEKIMDYPVGAGLGRWGMIASYFGDPSNLRSPPLHCEIQATAWLYDGGFLELLVGYAALLGACLVSLQIAVRVRDPRIADWAALAAALNVGTLANTLTYPVFASQTGLMCWVLNGMLFAAAVYRGPAVKARKRVAA